MPEKERCGCNKDMSKEATGNGIYNHSQTGNISDQEELIQIIRANAENLAFKVMHKYRDLKSRTLRFEKERPQLLKKIDFDPDALFKLPPTGKLRRLSEKDLRIINEYLRVKSYLDIMDTVIEERLRNTDPEIIKDICVHGLNAHAAASKNGRSWATGKRARVHAKKAFADEVQLRFMTNDYYPSLSDDVIENLVKRKTEK